MYIYSTFIKINTWNILAYIYIYVHSRSITGSAQHWLRIIAAVPKKVDRLQGSISASWAQKPVINGVITPLSRGYNPS